MWKRSVSGCRAEAIAVPDAKACGDGETFLCIARSGALDCRRSARGRGASMATLGSAPAASAARSPLTRSIAFLTAVNMPSERMSILSIPSASMSSLSHSRMVRSSIAAFSIGTISASGPREMTKPPTCCERCRGKPWISPTSRTKCSAIGAEGSSPASRNCAATSE